MTGRTGPDPMYAITRGTKRVESRSRPAPAGLAGQTIAIHAGKSAVREPGVSI